jgi:basic membrane protein A
LPARKTHESRPAVRPHRSRDQSFNDSAAASTAATDSTSSRRSPPTADADRAERLKLLADQGNELVIGIGFLWGDPIAAGAKSYPDTNFLQIDGGATGDNVTLATFAEHEGSYLVGVAAALTSESGKIGFLGGVNNSLIQKFEAGFVAGAKAANPDVEVTVEYITPDGDFTGFTSPDKAKEIANSMFSDGMDIIYAAAGPVRRRHVRPRREHQSSGSKVWGIGVDSDQYFTVDPSLRDYVLTSMIKRVDTRCTTASRSTRRNVMPER